MKRTNVIINGQETMPLFRTASDAYRKKPVVVHARQIDKPFEVHTLEGIMKGKAGDWLIMGVEKELYPCDDKIFKKTYEKAHMPEAEAPRIGKDKVKTYIPLDRIERMLKWLIMNQSPSIDHLPDISDIIEEKK